MRAAAMQARTTLTTASSERASHTPSLHATTHAPVGGTSCAEIAGSQIAKSSQSASPIERLVARPPGHMRNGPLG